jgi:ASC-1-like (ASCH) protein
MKLFKEPFFKIVDEEKKIEVRLFDEKRSIVKLGDIIEFTLIDNPKHKITVKVVGLSRFKTFAELYSSFDCKKFGHPANIKLGEQIEGVRECYSEEKEEKFGVLGIHIKKIKV